jgi:hypothetical protein
VLHDESDEGTTGMDDAYARAYFAEIGAEIMGAGMFGFHTFPDDPDWQGWWGGGPTVVREYLAAGLVDQLHVAITPILLGRGIRLWDDLRGLESGYDVHSETSESGIIHLTFSR